MNIGLLGYGNMGRNHYRVLSCLREEHHFWLSVWDPALSRPELERLARLDRGISYLDDRDMLESGWADAVIVATPTETHLHYINRALARDLPMFVEKPVVAPGQVLPLGARPFVGYVERYNLAVRMLVEQVEAGLIGSVEYVETERVNGMAQGRWKCEGAIYDLGVHDFDLLHLLGLSDVFVDSAEVVRRGNRDVHASVGATAYAPGPSTNRIKIRCRMSWLEDVKRRQVTVYGSRGVARACTSPWPPLFGTFRWSDANGALSEPVRFAEEPLLLEVADWLRGVRGLERSGLHHPDPLGLAAQRVASDAVRKADL